MKFVGLISGGKDSLYTLIKCIEYGHTLIAVANLKPIFNDNDNDEEDINSFMYQSVAYNVIPAVAECLDVPLIQRNIEGKSKIQTLDYEADDDDEVEDLYKLLKEVKEKYSDIEGISVGAIASTFQRLRVEHVCNRLGLQPLAYLWEKERSSLLNEMIENDKVNAILVKVAGAGLEPYKHLGKSLFELSNTLYKLNQKYGLDVCGEGGEYETLVLDCFAYKKRLELINTRIVLDKEDISVGYFKILEWKCVDKDSNDKDKIILNNNENVISLQLQDTINKFLSSESLILVDKTINSNTYKKLPLVFTGVDGIGQTPIIMPLYRNNSNSNEMIEIQNQVKDIILQFKEILTSIGSELADIVFIHLYISEVKFFALVNEEYCKWFGRNPPSRSCVACPLPNGCYAAADATFFESSHRTIQLGRSNRRQVLHIRSISEWAPVCIGPYAQANLLMDMFVYVSGQIPLNPATMTIWNPDPNNIISNVLQQLALCLRHSTRILGSLNSNLKLVTLCTVYLNVEKLQEYGFIDWLIIQNFVKEMIMNNCCEKVIHTNNQDEAAWSRSIDTYGDPDSEDEIDEKEKYHNPPIILIGVKGIPRDALVEVEVAAISKTLKEEDLESSSFTLIQGEKSDKEYDNILSWPIWKVESCHPIDTNTTLLKGDVTLIYLPKCICSGVIDIKMINTSSNDHITLDSSAMAILLRDCLHKLTAISNIDMHFLKQLKVFYSINGDIVFQHNEIVSLLSSYLSMNTVQPIPLLVVPINKLKQDVILSVSFSFINLLQMKSEAWINGK